MAKRSSKEVVRNRVVEYINMSKLFHSSIEKVMMVFCGVNCSLSVGTSSVSLQQLACGRWPVRPHVLLHNACRRSILNKYVQYMYNGAGECHPVMDFQNTMTHALFGCE